MTRTASDTSAAHPGRLASSLVSLFRLSLLSLLFVAVPSVAPVFGHADGHDHEEDVELLAEYIVEGDYEDAEELIDELGDHAPLLWRVRFLRETGKISDAIRWTTESKEYRAGDAQYLVTAAGLRLEVGQRDEAEKELLKALEKDSKNIEARTRLGLLLIEEGDRTKGRAHLNKVIDYYRELSTAEAEKLSPDTYVWMGHACIGLDRFRDAYSVMYESALDLDGGNVAAHVASGYALLSKYNYPDARSHYKDALKTNRRHAEANIAMASAVYVDIGYRGSRFGDTESALDAADRVWKDHPETLILRGHLAFYDEDWPVAEEYYRRASQVDPRNLTRRGHVAAVLFATGRLDEFQAECKAVEEMHPSPAEFYTVLAERLVDRFFYREAAEYAAHAISLDPDYWRAYVIRGMNALRIGEDDEGRKWSERAFEADPFNIWASNTLKLIKHIDKNFVTKQGEFFRYRMRREDAPFLMPYLEPLMEEAKVRMERQYLVELEHAVTIEDFSKHDYFSARSVGLPGLAASGVCFGSLVTLTTPKAIPGNWGAVAVHEFAHVIALQKTGHRVPRWFTEGLSVFEEGRNRPRWRRIYAQEFVDAVHHQRLLPMANLQSGFTKPTHPGQVLLSYYQGGVICTYIEKEWGWGKIVEMLDAYRSGKDTRQVFQSVLGKSLESFDRGFFKYVREVSDSYGLWCRYLPDQIETLRYESEDRPGDVDAMVKLGLAYYWGRRTADAELILGKAMKIDPEHADLNALKGMLDLQQKRTKSAITAFEKAIANGTNYRYRARMGLAALLAKRNKSGAIKALRQAIEIHQDAIQGQFGRPNAYYQLAQLLFDEGKDDEAIEVLQTLAQLDRDDFRVRKQLATHFAQKDDWGKVIALAGDAPFIDPYDSEIHWLLAEAYLKSDAFQSARREYEILLNYEEPAYNRIYPELAWCMFKLGDVEEARKMVDRAIELDPSNDRAREVKKAMTVR